ncbi:MAG: hypothetical protein ACRDO7_11205 [Nocardioidaceae bacterium]
MPESTADGFGRVLVAVYAVFALAATARSTVQIATRFADAPGAYLLSGLAGVVYIVATVALGLGRDSARGAALVAILIELIGVLTVGTLSVADPELFPDATVWSDFGRGYGYVPLVLPFVGLWWLRRTRGSAQ